MYLWGVKVTLIHRAELPHWHINVGHTGCFKRAKSGQISKTKGMKVAECKMKGLEGWPFCCAHI